MEPAQPVLSASPVDDDRRPDGRWLVAAFAVVIVAFAAYFAAGMPGMGHGGGTSATMAGGGDTSMAIDSDRFADRLAEADAVVVNVHVPDEGSIAGTDLTIPFDRIVGDQRLPADRATPLLLYCKTGRMSAEAAVALMAEGYTDVAYLDGGMDRWRADGRLLE